VRNLEKFSDLRLFIDVIKESIFDEKSLIENEMKFG
jgi:hypothetical protein